MLRRRFLHTVAAGTLTGAAARAATPSLPDSPTPSAPGPTDGLVASPLVLMAPRADGLEAVWSVRRLARGVLEWRSADGASSGRAATDPFGFVPQGDHTLRVRVTGLLPGRLYQARAVTTAADDGAVETGAWKEFRTLDPDAGRAAFVVWNDTHANAATLRQLHSLTPAADFLVWNGDTCNDWKSGDLLAPTLLYPAECDISAGRPLCLVWGNHDVRGRHAYRMPEFVATPSGRPFYALRSGPVAAVVLHTGEDKPDTHPSFGGRVAFDQLRREQASWLGETLRRPEFAEAPYRVVFCHIPLRWTDESPQDYAARGYDRHSGRSRAAWHDALVAWRTQVIISGHTHRPAWLPPTETFPYGQLVGGGPAPAAATWIEADADPHRLRLVMRGLDGAVRHDLAFPPLA